MTDATATAPPSPWFDILKAALPYFGQVLVLLATFGTGMVTQHVIQKPAPPPMSLPAADKPRPVPIVSISDVDASLQTHCGEIKALLLERLPAPRTKAPSR